MRLSVREAQKLAVPGASPQQRDRLRVLARRMVFNSQMFAQEMGEARRSQEKEE